MTDLELRAAIYRHFGDTGVAPTVASLVSLVGDPAATRECLTRLHNGHMIVLGGDDEIAMALPFSASATEHVVTSGRSSWWANCAWDAFAVIAALHDDGHIVSTWHDTGGNVDISITDGQLSSEEGYVHFAVPARHWWDDIVET